MRVLRTAAIAVCVVFAVSPAAFAQVYIGRDAPRHGSFEIGGGGAWAGGFDMGSRRAELTRSTSNDPFDLFSSDSKVASFPGAHVRLGFYLTGAVSVEGGVRLAQPKLSVRLTGDAESAADTTATETLSHYVFDGSLLYHFTKASFAGGRGVPFISGGAGYLRELHEENALVETGREYHATAGLKYWFGTGKHRFGLRGEIGLTSREKGFDHDQPRRTLPLALGGLAFLF
jgi:hypothetical protein